MIYRTVTADLADVGLKGSQAVLSIITMGIRLVVYVKFALNLFRFLLLPLHTAAPKKAIFVVISSQFHIVRLINIEAGGIHQRRVCIWPKTVE